MLRIHNFKAKSMSRSRTAIAAFVATLAVGGSATEASARSGHHHRHHVAARHHHHAATVAAAATDAGPASWLNANASIFHATRSFSGMASYYGNESGRKTASGQRFNQNAMTCAHRSLPFGTKLRVTHGGQSVIVTVNDRGPFIRGRVLDLSTGAARAIGLTAAGVGRVTAEVVS
jgi:peptidoglycan lytic transglycosylase